MSEAKHTPGPWRIDMGYIGQDLHPFVVIPGEDGLLIRNPANARLIATAPDLLAACRIALGCYEEFARSHMLSDAALADMETIRAAIAEAEQS